MLTDDKIVPLEDQLEWQERYCRGANSPTAAEVMRAVLDDLRGRRLLAALLPSHARSGDLIGLRIMAAVHRLAIDRLAPGVALFAPTLGGVAPSLSPDPISATQAFHNAVIEAMIRNPDAIRRSLDQVPQTNEVGRSRLLRIALSRLRGDVRMCEFGASAGLNLRADHLPADPSLESGPMPRIVERLGCDLNPIDPTTPEGRARLTSYVWLDDVDRFERLREALRIAMEIPATVIKQDAADFVQGLELQHGSTMVLWHSSMWVYLSEQTRVRIVEQVERLGATASTHSPLWHVAWEPIPDDRNQHELTLQVWDGSPQSGAIQAIARGTTHGRKITLLPAGPAPGAAAEAGSRAASEAAPSR